jgi:PncC family amidohydrolase
MVAATETIPERRVAQLLTAAGLRLATAESCTGGLIAHRITNVPGSSEYFLGGVISYSNEAKERILGVSPATLERFGAVSEQTSGEMAAGARRLFGAELAVSATGIAGPGGGTPNKPVGLVYVALSAPDAQWSREFVWSGDREENKRLSADAALALLIEYLEVVNRSRPNVRPSTSPLAKR